MNSSYAVYCEAHRTPQQQMARLRRRVRADPQKYAQWRERNKEYCRQYKIGRRDHASTERRRAAGSGQ